MEDLDMGVHINELLTNATIHNIKNSDRQATSLPFIAHCYYCDSTVKQPRVFCDAGCRDDWEAEQKLLRNAGR